jgi:hypothetical protein
MDDTSEYDDLAWQAQVLLTHKRRRRYRSIIIFGTVCVGLLFCLIVVIYLVYAPSGQARSADGLQWFILPLMLLSQLALYIIWRCPACDETLRRGDPQFCPGCGAQLRFPRS